MSKLTDKLTQMIDRMGPENFDPEKGEFFVLVVGSIDDNGLKRAVCSNLKTEAMNLVMTPPQKADYAAIEAYQKNPDGTRGERLPPEQEQEILKRETAAVNPIADLLEAMILSGAAGPLDKSKLN